jgi:hypothetical protein
MKPTKKKNTSLDFYKETRKPMPKPSRAHDPEKYIRDKSWKKNVNKGDLSE